MLLISVFSQTPTITQLMAAAIGCFLSLMVISGFIFTHAGIIDGYPIDSAWPYCNEPWLKGMGIVSALLFVSGYYYSLETTLLLKSAYLMGLGALLLVARMLMWRLFPANENAKGDLMWNGQCGWENWRFHKWALGIVLFTTVAILLAWIGAFFKFEQLLNHGQVGALCISASRSRSLMQGITWRWNMPLPAMCVAP